MQVMVLDAHKTMLKNYIFQNMHHKIIQEAKNIFHELLL
jgi:hypothetical protein